MMIIRSWEGVQGGINHWCNVSAVGEANARGSIYCLPLRTKHCVFWQCSGWLSSPPPTLALPFQQTRRDSYTQQWGWGSIIYACELWIYRASEGQYMFYTTLPSIYFGWGYDLIACRSVDDGYPDLSARVRQGTQLKRFVRTDMPNVLSPVVYDWLTVLLQVSVHPSCPAVITFRHGAVKPCVLFSSVQQPTEPAASAFELQPTSSFFSSSFYLLIRITVTVN